MDDVDGVELHSWEADPTPTMAKLGFLQCVFCGISKVRRTFFTKKGYALEEPPCISDPAYRAAVEAEFVLDELEEIAGLK